MIIDDIVERTLERVAENKKQNSILNDYITNPS